MISRCACTLLLVAACLANPLLRAAENPDEIAVKAVVQRFLTELGNGNLDALPPLFASKASIAYAQLREGQWTTVSTSFEDWHAALKARTNRTRFHEPVSRWSVQIDDGQLAFVRAETQIEREDRITSRNIDYFTLLKVDGTWKIANGSYVGKPVAVGDKR